MNSACVKIYLNNIIKGLEDSQIKNKASLKTIKDAFMVYDEKLFVNYCKQTLIDQYKKDSDCLPMGNKLNLDEITYTNKKGLFTGLNSNEYIINSYNNQCIHAGWRNYCFLIYKNNDSILQNKSFNIAAPQKYIDVNNDGLSEILCYSGFTNMGASQGKYTLVSLKNDTVSILYSIDNFTGEWADNSNKKVGDLISKNVDIDFKDLDGDGILELIETVTNGYFQSYNKATYVTNQTFKKTTNTYYLVSYTYVIKK